MNVKFQNVKMGKRPQYTHFEKVPGKKGTQGLLLITKNFDLPISYA